MNALRMWRMHGPILWIFAGVLLGGAVLTHGLSMFGVSLLEGMALPWLWVVVGVAILSAMIGWWVLPFAVVTIMPEVYSPEGETRLAWGGNYIAISKPKTNYPVQFRLYFGRKGEYEIWLHGSSLLGPVKADFHNGVVPHVVFSPPPPEDKSEDKKGGQGKKGK